MIGGPTRRLRLDPVEPKFRKIERLHERIDHTNRIVLSDPVLQALGKQCALPAIRPFNEAPHPTLPQIARESYRENQI